MNTNKKIYRLIFAALFIALCFVGGNIKIMGSIAFDSLPAFLGTLFLGYGWGAAIGALAHMLSAMLSGFPMTLPVHIITAGMMALTMVGFLATVRALKKKNEIVAYIMGCIVAVIINVPLGLMAVIPFIGKETAFALIPALLPAAIANVVLAVIIYMAIPKKFKDTFKK